MKVGSFSVDHYFHPDAQIVSMGACAYYRLALPLRALAGRGYDIVLGLGTDPVKPIGDPPDRLFTFGIGKDGAIAVDNGHEWVEPDVIIFERWMGQHGADIVRSARAAGQIVLQDVDDLLWELPAGHPALKAIHPRYRTDYNTDHYRRMLAASDGIIVSTPLLADYLEPLGPPVFLCRNTIDLAEWVHFDQPDGLNVAWVGTAPWRAGGDVRQLQGVLGPFLSRNHGRFIHLGHKPDAAGTGKRRPHLPVYRQLMLPGTVPHEERPQTTIWDYAKAWNGLGIVVVPLERCRFNTAKSWLRGLEAAAAGCPFVATDLPEYRELGFGRTARTAGEWTAHLEALLDLAARRAEAYANYAAAIPLSIEHQWVQWADVLTEFGVRPAELVTSTVSN